VAVDHDACVSVLEKAGDPCDSEIGRFQAYLLHYRLSRDYSLFVMSNGHSRLWASARWHQ